VTTVAIATPGSAAAVTPRFYRPELDAVRFFAFVAVLLHHGPQGQHFLWTLSAAGGFGLSMFFLLSAYLITELLLREREQTKTVAWRLFFIRRALRIWPLYYAALTVAFIIGRILPHSYRVSRTAIIVMSLFVANWSKLSASLGTLVGHLWSLSIEEQFYLVWPPIIKFGGKKAALIASIIFVFSAVAWLGFMSHRGWLLWYDTPVEFVFFAAGAIIALVMHRRPPQNISVLFRGALLLAGLFVLISTAHFGYVSPEYVPGVTSTRLYIKYGGAVAGCVIVFLAALGMPNVPRALVYFGKISYGLYVFHLAMLQLSIWCVAPIRLPYHSAANMLLVDGLALLLTLVAAHFSYQCFEKPFIRLKERFAVIRSRPA
jgi:peptidoglycan/LPS O-acetylase OafA/YrhL